MFFGKWSVYNPPQMDSYPIGVIYSSFESARRVKQKRLGFYVPPKIILKQKIVWFVKNPR